MEEITSFNEVISNVFKNISLEESNKAINIYNEWKKILCKIKSSNPNEGQNISEHSRVIDLKNGILLIEVDHPGWQNLIQFYKKFILKGFEFSFPELKIKTLAFRLKGNDFGLAEVDSTEAVKEEIERRAEEEEKAIKNAGIKSDNSDNIKKNKEIPPEMKSIFESWQNSID